MDPPPRGGDRYDINVGVLGSERYNLVRNLAPT